MCYILFAAWSTPHNAVGLSLCRHSSTADTAGEAAQDKQTRKWEPKHPTHRTGPISKLPEASLSQRVRPHDCITYVIKCHMVMQRLPHVPSVVTFGRSICHALGNIFMVISLHILMFVIIITNYIRLQISTVK